MSKPSLRLVCTVLAVVAIVMMALAFRRFFNPAPQPASTTKRFLPHIVRHQQSDAAIDDLPPEGTDTGLHPGQVVTAHDLRRALLQVARLKHSRQRMDAIFELGKQLGAADFENAMALLDRLPDQWTRSVLTAGVYYSRGLSQGQLVLDELEQDKQQGEARRHKFPGFDEAFAKGGALAGWASADPRAAIAWAKEKDDSGFKHLAYNVWGFQDIDAMLAFTQTLPVGVTDTAGQQDFLTWAKADIDRAIQYAMSLPEDFRNAVLERVAHGYATNWSTPYRADFLSLVTQVESANPEDFLSLSTYGWLALNDPRAAADGAAQLENENIRQKVLKTILTNWAELDTTSAVTWMHQHSDLISASQFTDKLSEVNPELAAQLFDADPAPRTNNTLASDILQNWFDWEPRAAFDWAAKKDVAPGEMLNITATVATKLGLLDPDEALEWARTLSDKTLQPTAYSGVALAQGFADQAKPTDWLLELPAGPARDRCLASYITGVLDHADKKTSPSLSDDLIDKSALAARIGESKLSGDEKNRLHRLLQN